ncbi:hypothetical protein [Mesobacillus zeae]|uniref:Uncharacterized protein n=1 Tax=Mesobacillus zeae TaxID=1917180 RepID=A0A398BNP4_9BACI|nr:hypothetical protein [Mesobacillus zeae]RID88983.1 hypothetical protein D1970_00335 [Mesobacillus zeae]
MVEVYEIANIEKHTELAEADSARIGRRFYIGVLAVGYRALLPHVDDEGKVLLTSVVDCVLGKEGDNEIIFTTVNSIYTLRKVVR